VNSASAVRARTALVRVALSRPMRLAIDDGLIVPQVTTVLDYGCGREGDIERLTAAGVRCNGWDPFHCPDGNLEPSDVVNLGYVVNVIEELEEREETLRRAWAFARCALIISARLEGESAAMHEEKRFGDGVRTTIGSFQKLYSQGELRKWVDSTLHARAAAAAPGVFIVFRHPALEQEWRLRRVRHDRRLAPVSRELLARHDDLIPPLIRFVTDRGRLPRGEELTNREEIEEKFGTLRSAFAAVRRVSGDERWDRIRDERSRDLLVFVALSRFDGTLRPKELPEEIRLDIRDLFGSHAAAFRQADRLLGELANGKRVRDAALASSAGKRAQGALYVHMDALTGLPPILRILEGAARRLIGEVAPSTLVKLHLDEPTVSYLEFPDFDSAPHPELRRGFVVRVDHLRCDMRDYSNRADRPILHRKELFLAQADPRRKRFAALTRQEERAGLYDRATSIGTRRAWNRLLAERRLAYRGHRLVKLATSAAAEGAC
jgi:DNA phosphorothioation-associated putative methyltransferase